MVNRYTPVIECKLYGCTVGEEYADMEQDPSGQWVKLETYNDAVAQKDAQIERLKKQISSLGQISVL